MTTSHPTPPGDRCLRNIDIRRAVLSALSLSPSPLTIADIVEQLALDGIEFGRAAEARKRLSDILRYQMTKGRVERVARGRYRFVQGSMAHATLWRCRNWRSVKR